MRSLFVVGKQIFQLVETIFFGPFFRDSCQFFFRLVEKYLSTKSFIPAGGSGFPGQWKLFSFSQSFSSKWKLSLKLREASFLKKTIFQLMKTDFWASGNNFLPFSQAAVNCYQWKQFFVQLKHIGNVETRFLSVLHIVLFQVFFL